MFDTHNGSTANKTNQQNRESDFFTIRFDYVPSMKSETYSISASFFEDNGEQYVESLARVETGESIEVPPYLAAKDLEGYLTTLWSHATSIQPVKKLD